MPSRRSLGPSKYSLDARHILSTGPAVPFQHLIMGYGDRRAWGMGILGHGGEVISRSKIRQALQTVYLEYAICLWTNLRNPQTASTIKQKSGKTKKLKQTN